jgi:predicted lipid-binding transport protein (Tim44 family)
MRLVVTKIKNIAGYGLWCAVVGCMLGALLVGIIGEGIHEYMTGIPSSPVLLVFTGSIGFVCGIIYGIWKEYC